MLRQFPVDIFPVAEVADDQMAGAAVPVPLLAERDQVRFHQGQFVGHIDRDKVMRRQFPEVPVPAPGAFP